MKYSIVILAAGQGKRMRSQTPKVLHKICDKEMLSFIIEEALKLSDDVGVVVYHQKEKLQEFIQKNHPNVKTYVQNHKNFPGTGGAIMHIDFRKQNVLVLNGDMPLVRAENLEKLTKHNMSIGVISLQDPKGYGRIVQNKQTLEKIVEEKDANEEERKINLVNAGVYFFPTAPLKKALKKLNNLNVQREYYITDLVKLIQNAGEKVNIEKFKENELLGVNSKLQLSNAQDLMQKRINEHWLENGVQMQNPSTICIGADVIFEGECEIQNGCSISGKTKIISSKILAQSVIEDSHIENSSIGPLARIRPKTKLINSKIGNFVETKNSSLKGVKAGHLSYLGDSEIDEGTNIGAGTITCNYDGKQKHKTIIGKNVFVGSDTQIIAPVTIEDEVLIAAGTTITENIEKGSLAISRVKQKNIANFFKKFFNA